MKNLPKNLGMLLLAVWLIVTGVLQVVKLPIPDVTLIMGAIAIVAGALILLQQTQGQGRSRFGF